MESARVAPSDVRVPLRDGVSVFVVELLNRVLTSKCLVRGIWFLNLVIFFVSSIITLHNAKETAIVMIITMILLTVLRMLLLMMMKINYIT